jgi:hypothetical protein
MEEFALSRRIIQFTLQEDRVRFMANSEAAERACLKISCRLLAIAEIIHDDLRRGRS